MTSRPVSRRAVLTGGVAAVAAAGTTGWLVEQDALPGRSRAYALLGLNGDPAPVPDVEPGPTVRGRFSSAARGGAPTRWSVSYPPGSSPGDPLPLLLVLHGASGDHATVTEELGMDRFLAAHVRGSGGAAGFAVAAADGGPTYWREQPDGTDSSAMLLDELLPMLGRRGLDVTRPALTGWSMGGYGALLLAHREPGRFACVGAMSPALTPGQPADLDVLGHPEWFTGLPVRLDCGRGDPFYPHVRDFAAALEPAPESSFGSGGHTPGYWREVVPAQLAFAGTRLG